MVQGAGKVLLGPAHERAHTLAGLNSDSSLSVVSWRSTCTVQPPWAAVSHEATRRFSALASAEGSPQLSPL